MFSKLLGRLHAGLQASRASHFLQSVGILVVGTLVAQVITAAVLLFTTRLYSPADFSALAVFSGATLMFCVAACLRFDVAVPLPESKAVALNLVALALTASMMVSMAIGITVWIAGTAILHWVGRPELRPYLWLIPFGVWTASTLSALQFWHIRRHNFALIARVRVVQVVAGACIQLAAGLAGAGALGLIGGYMVSLGAGAVVLLWIFCREELPHGGVVSRVQMCSTFASYRRFPCYSTFEALANSAGIQLPVILIAGLALVPEAGFLWLAMFAMQAPMALVGTAIGQVYLARAPEQFRKGELPRFTSQVFGGLLRSGVGPLMLIGVVAPDLFALIFGPNWRRAGELVRWMIPWFVLQFVATPISMALLVTGHQRVGMLLQIFGLVVRVSAVWVIAAISRNMLSEAYALSGLIFYLLYACVILATTGCSWQAVRAQIARALPVMLSWVGLGIVIELVVSASRAAR